MLFDLVDALAHQRLRVEERVCSGERIVGYKVALTSPAARRRLGAPAPIWGYLTNSMEITDGILRTYQSGELRIEPEIVFTLNADLVGPGVGVDHVLAATESVHAGLDIPSHGGGGRVRSVGELVASNAGACHFVIGEAVAGPQLVTALLCVVVQDGEEIRRVTADGAYLRAAAAVATLTNSLAARGEELHAGMMIFTGGLCPPIEAVSGTQLLIDFGTLGRLDLGIE